jgi:hypothetical protein
MAQSHAQIKGIVCPELMDGQGRLFILLGINIAYTDPEISAPLVSISVLRTINIYFVSGSADPYYRSGSGSATLLVESVSSKCASTQYTCYFVKIFVAFTH